MRDKNERKQRVKNMLFAGQKLTKFYLDRLLNCTNSAEIIRQLRKEMEIKTEWKKSEEGTRYGVYSWVKPEKISRIETRQYLEQA